MSEFNSYIGKQYKKPREYFSLRKFIMGFFGFTPVAWAKDFISILNVRKLIIYAIIIGSIFGYGYIRGHGNTPVKIDIGYDNEAIIELTPESQLHIYRDGTVWLEDRQGNKLKQVSVKDIKGLKDKLAPIGFQLDPIAVVGAGISDYGESGIEAGAGVSIFRVWQYNLDAFITNHGYYGGVSYSLKQLNMDNTTVGIGVGKGWDGDNRGILYFRLKF
jgi:hypothetical protein